MSKRNRNLIIIVGALVVLIGIALIVGRGQRSTVTVSVVSVKPSTFNSKLPESGIVQRPRVATIPALISGNLAQIYVKPGDNVAAGQLLATIVNPTLAANAAGSQADYNSAAANISTARINEQNAKVGYEAAVQTAKTNLDEAQRIYKADVNLYNNKAIPRNQVDLDKAKLDQAQVQYSQALRQLQLGAVAGYGQSSVQYAQAAAQKAQILNQSNQQQLGFTRISAPVDGTIQTVATQPSDPLTQLRPGDPVTAGQGLFTIAAGGGFVVKAQVDEQDIINVRLGQPVDVTGQDFPGRTLTGRVASISPVATKSTDPSSTARQIVTTVRLDQSPSFLRDGMTVDVDILTTNVKNALVVPTAALGKDGKRAYVFVVRKGKLIKTYVSTGTKNDTQTVVKSGLARGDKVVAATTPLLRDGETVTTAPAGKATPAS
ncbi:MAG TPA: efflux RND transporter periplasmic adaptor subunit [Candidatus Rubrimentiphilum sp.]|nr:efflux RND transporter periplasmic adaptor subunit [Candidatus Rubrimentiphilum sp.]